MTSETCWTSIPRAQTSVVIKTRLRSSQFKYDMEQGPGYLRCTTSELRHDSVSFLLHHLTVH